MTTQAHTQAPLERLRHHVTGAIERGESVPVVEVSAPATHTPGPWEIGSINKRDKNLWWSAVFTPKSTGKFHTPRACEALGVDREECEANARLIAAAPELLEALKAMLRSFETGEHYETRNPYCRPYVKGAIEAIAKAERGQQ